MYLYLASDQAAKLLKMGRTELLENQYGDFAKNGIDVCTNA